MRDMGGATQMSPFTIETIGVTIHLLEVDARDN